MSACVSVTRMCQCYPRVSVLDLGVTCVSVKRNTECRSPKPALLSTLRRSSSHSFLPYVLEISTCSQV